MKGEWFVPVKTRVYGDWPGRAGLGSLRRFYNRWELDRGEAVLIPAKDFDATLTLVSYARGGHSVYTIWADKAQPDIHYPISLVDMLNALKQAVHGEITGTWAFTKRGNAYGVKLVASDQDVPEVVEQLGP